MMSARDREWALANGYTFAWADDWEVDHFREYYAAYGPADVPEDFPVRPLDSDDDATALATCGECGRSWDDAISTEWTPAPSARCPFEYFHGGEPNTCELCTMYDTNGAIVASLCCIDDADDEYRREIEGQLAAEARPEWERRTRRNRSTQRARRRHLARRVAS